MNMSTVIMVSAVYNKPLDNKLTVFQALRQLIRENVNLNVNVFNHTSKKPILRLIDRVDLDKVVAYQPEVELEAFADGQFQPNNKFAYDVDEVLWKLYIIGKDLKTAVFVFDHVAFDGTSGTLFHKKFVSALNSPIVKVDHGDQDTSHNDASGSADSENNLVQGGHTELNPCLEHYGQTKPGVWYVVKTIAKMTKEKFVKPKVWQGPVPEVPQTSKSVYLKYDPEKTSKLVQVAKSKQVSVQALLSTAILQALALECPDKKLHIELGTPVNARRFAGIGEELGCFVYEYMYTLKNYANDTKPGYFVDSWASDFYQGLQRALARCKEIAWVLGLLDHIDIKDYFKEQLKEKRTLAAEVSNLGVVNFDEGEYSVSEIALSQPITGTGAPVIVSAATAAGGWMTLQISCTPDDDNKTKCTRLRDEFARVLDSLI